MAGPTIHQRVNGWLWHWESGPGWVRNPNELKKLRYAENGEGMRLMLVQAQDDGPIPREYADMVRSAGMKFGIAIGHVDGRDPKEVAQWLRNERVRLAATYIDCNFEEDVRAMDAASNGQWSAVFAAEARKLMPTMPMALDTYFGPAAATNGINLGAYKQYGFRLRLQSYWGDGIYDDPSPRMVQWTSGANPPWPKSLVKPLHRVVRPGSGPYVGQLPNWDVVFADQKAAGLKGVGFYHIDGCDFDLLLNLVKDSVKKGIAY